jgi:hypothetical protein
MADTHQRSAAVQASYGYRQLPGGGATGGPDLKTVVCVGVGVFFGILVGTTIADGSWRSLNPLVQRHTAVQVSSNNPVPVNHPVAKTAQTSPLQLQASKQGSPQPVVAGQPATTPSSLAPQTPVAQVRQPAPTQSQVAPQAPVTQQVSGAQQFSSVQRASATQRVPATHKRRLLHKVAARKRHFGRRKGHIRHRLHAVRKTEVAAGLASNVPVPESSAAAIASVSTIPSAFTVRGEVTVASYDATAGIVETYEGETFALDKTQTASGAVPWDEYVPNIHYSCDQFGNCTLNRGGQSLLKAKRTR